MYIMTYYIFWYSILDRFFFSVFSLNSSDNCLNTKDKIFAPMDGGRTCFFQQQKNLASCFTVMVEN